MSTVEAGERWLEAAGDHLNAILVKETRQSFKSRQFVVTFLLMLVSSWLISILGVMLSGAGTEYRETGPGFFVAYYIVLAIAVFVIVPFGAFRSLLVERDLNTFELLNITTLSPRRIIWGKLLSSLVQLFIYYSAITPFLAFTYMLNGITIPTIVFLLVLSMLISLHLSMFSLMLSTFAQQRVLQVLLSLSLLGGLVSTFLFTMGMVSSRVIFEIPFDDPALWWSTAVVISFFIPTFVLYLQVATAQLTFESDNHSTGIRITSAILAILPLGWIALNEILTTSSFGDEELIIGVSVGLVLWLCAVGLFAVTEEPYLSRRVRRELPRLGLFRFMMLPLLPGAGRGWLYILKLFVVVWLGLCVLFFINQGELDNHTLFVTLLCVYAISYLGLGSLVGRLIRPISDEFGPAHARVLMLFLFAGGSVLPHMVGLFIGTNPWRDYPGLFISDPMFSCGSVLTGTGWNGAILVVAPVAFLVVLCQLPLIVKGIHEVLAAEVAPRKPRVEAPGPIPATTPIVATDDAT